MASGQVLKVDTPIQTDSSDNIIVNKCSLLLFLIKVKLKLQDLLSKTNCTGHKMKKLYEKLLEEIDEFDKLDLTIEETNVKRNLQKLNSIFKENCKDITKLISAYYTSMDDQSMSTISSSGNLSRHTRYFSELLASFLLLSSSFEKQSWFSDIFLEPAWKWDPLNTGSQQHRNAISEETFEAPQDDQDEDDHSSCSTIVYNDSILQRSSSNFDSRNSFPSQIFPEIDWKKHIRRLQRMSQSMEVIEMKFFLLRSRDIHFLQTLSRFEEPELLNNY